MKHAKLLAILFVSVLAVLVPVGGSVRAAPDSPGGAWLDTPIKTRTIEPPPTETPVPDTATPWPTDTPYPTATWVTPTSPPPEYTPESEPTPTDGFAPDPTATETPGAERDPRASPTPNMVMPETGLPLLPTFFLGFAFFAVAFIVGMIRRAR